MTTLHCILLFLVIHSATAATNCTTHLEGTNLLKTTYVSASSEKSTATAANVFTTGWCAATDKQDEWVQFTFPTPIGIQAVIVAPLDNQATSYPTLVHVQYMPNGQTTLQEIPVQGGMDIVASRPTINTSSFGVGQAVKAFRFILKGYHGHACMKVQLIGCPLSVLCPSGCQHGGICSQENRCDCIPGYTGATCEQKACQPAALGLGDGRISMNNVHVSSEDPYHTKNQIRLSDTTTGWCAASTDTSPWVQVKLDKPMAISKFVFHYITRKEGEDKMFTRTFNLQYVPALDKSGMLWSYANDIPCLNGTHYFDVTIIPKVVTDTIRIVSNTVEKRACFKLDIHGCDPTTMCSSGWCMNGGQCMGNNACSCPTGFVGARCDQKAADITATNLGFIKVVQQTLVTPTYNFTVSGHISLQTVNHTSVVTITGTNNYITLPVTPTSCLTNIDYCTSGFTLGIDINFAMLLDNTYILSSGGNLPGHQGIVLLYTHNSLTYIVSSSTQQWTLVVPYHAVTNTWQHFELSWNKNLGIELLVNGHVLGSVGRPANRPATQQVNFCIACSHHTGVSNNVSMQIKDIVTWSLDRTELVNAGLKPTPVSTNTPLSTVVACPAIAHCTSRHCTNTTNVRCTKCEDNMAFYKLTTGATLCERKCAWNNHYCWPGTCADDLTKNCQCAPGFRLVSRGDAETSCQLEATTAPIIHSCRTSFQGSHGEHKYSDKFSSATACQYLKDIYGNFQPALLHFDLMTEFAVDISSLYRPYFVHATHFGVTDTTVYLSRQPVSGSDVLLDTVKLQTYRNSSTELKSTSSASRNLTLPYPQYRLTDGQRLCVKYEALGGGYLDTVDPRHWPHTVSNPVPYQKTNTTKEICYRYDSTPPRHCLEDHACTQQPLEIQHRITRSGIVQVEFTGWTDPIPPGGSPDHASGIESYTITVNEILPSQGRLHIDTGLVYTTVMNHTQLSTTLNLTSASPKMYSVKLKVKDAAGNVKQARRFVLYDNSSSIMSNATSPFTVTSASMSTNYTWQTHTSDVCIDWKDHFYNDFYIGHPLLNAIEMDPTGLIQGVYEQTDSPLPVSGTLNVHGIVHFMVSSKVDDDVDFSQETQVLNLTNQSYCQRFDVFDGQTYTLKIKAIDTINNSYSEERAVHIDGSPPNIINIAIIKDGHRRHNAHSAQELREMNIIFEALDFHSGIKSIDWSFSVMQTAGFLRSGSLQSGTISEPDCFNQITPCYCPNVGPCELHRYNVPLWNIVNVNAQYRNYVFTLNVTNHAMLSSNRHIDVSIVDSSAGLVGR